MTRKVTKKKLIKILKGDKERTNGRQISIVGRMYKK